MSRRSIAMLAGCIALVIAVAAALPFTPAMPVKSIDVAGTVNLSEEEVQALAGIEPDTPMGRVDVHRAARQVAANPWVETANVKRDWPSAVDVTVTEHVPVAWVDQGGEKHLIDREGRDFVVAEPPAGTVQLVGVDSGNENQMRDAVAVASSISEKARPRVRELATDGPYNFVLMLDDGRPVTWGPANDNQNKALALETVLQLEGQSFNITNPELVTSR